MTRKDYQLIAQTFQDTLDGAVCDERDGINALAQNLAFALLLDNPRFDKRRFLDACGVA